MANDWRSSVSTLRDKIAASVDNFDVRTSKRIGAIRSAIALAQLSILALTSSDDLFASVNGKSGPKCDEMNSISVFCVAGVSETAGVAFCVAALILVVVGYYPRWTAWLHVYVTFSLSSALQLPDGGEAVAKVTVFFLAFVLLSDDRINHWAKNQVTSEGRFQPVSWGAALVFRAQVFWIYATASIGKMGVPEWQEGTAFYYVVRQSFFGASWPTREFTHWVTEFPAVTVAVTWGTMIVELLIAFLVLRSRRQRFAALALSAALHGFIIVLMGLWSFSIIMVATVALTTAHVGKDSQLISKLADKRKE